jgi:hypothetical protein
MDRKSHWENVYQTKQANEVGWTQEVPEASLRMLRSLNLPKSASIIDIGGGDSHLPEILLDDGYSDITVLDISASGIERAKKRLGERANLVKWIVSDIIDFEPDRVYDLWHDRAAFHFLTKAVSITQYVKTASEHVSGYITIGTFSLDGPKKCSGLDIRQYNEKILSDEFSPKFDMIDSFREDHITPSGNKQNFQFCTLKKCP